MKMCNERLKKKLAYNKKPTLFPSDGAIALTMAHTAAYMDILHHNYPMAFVVEDDAVFSAGFAQKIKTAISVRLDCFGCLIFDSFFSRFFLPTNGLCCFFPATNRIMCNAAQLQRVISPASDPTIRLGIW
jgi:GR25 family glycosyltransferase involved in LPS biosynthesis